MSTIQNLFEQTLLSEAAYADLSGTIENQSELQKALDVAFKVQYRGSFSASQATEFVTHWKVKSHQSNTVSGFSATLFESLDHPGTYTYAVRGTEPATDLLSDLVSADVYGIGGQGFAIYQALDMYNNKNATKMGSESFFDNYLTEKVI